MINQAPNRRHILRLMAGVPLLAAGAHPAFAALTRPAADPPTKTAQIERLIREAQAFPRVAQRIDFISAGLLGVRYRANTLIGSPKLSERFVVRDDAFDCVTYCEVVLAAAMASDLDGFETALRRIRYDHGAVQYDRRNHYFADWCARNIANGICRPVAIDPPVVFDKTLTWHREFGNRRVSIAAVDKTTLMANTKKLAPGDIIGFVSRRAGLDYYHTGLIAFSKSGELMLRDASQSHRRVVEEKMATFATVNPVKYVTVLRAAESTPVAERR